MRADEQSRRGMSRRDGLLPLPEMASGTGRSATRPGAVGTTDRASDCLLLQAYLHAANILVDELGEAVINAIRAVEAGRLVPPQGSRKGGIPPSLAASLETCGIVRRVVLLPPSVSKAGAQLTVRGGLEAWEVTEVARRLLAERAPEFEPDQPRLF